MGVPRLGSSGALAKSDQRREVSWGGHRCCADVDADDRLVQLR